MFWSDITSDTIHQANLDGTDEVILVDTCLSTVGKDPQLKSVRKLIFFSQTTLQWIG